MTKLRKTALENYRHRMRKRGVVRVEVQVRKEDAALVRGVANALADPAREARTRALLRERFLEPSRDLKALLAAAPLEGVDLERSRDLGREIDL